MNLTSLPAGIAGDLHATADFLATHHHPDDIVINLRVPGSTRPEKLAGLQQIADDWGVRIGKDSHGTQFAERRFGYVRIEAHVTAEDLSQRIAARQDERPAA